MTDMAMLVLSIKPPPSPENYTLSLHDALPILAVADKSPAFLRQKFVQKPAPILYCGEDGRRSRSEEHTSELQSRRELVCRLLLEKKNRRFHTAECARQCCRRRGGRTQRDSAAG